jgi:hypothetical protein
MRDSKIDLTMQHYTDPKLLDVRGALDAFPDLPLDGGPSTDEGETLQALRGPDRLGVTSAADLRVNTDT